MSKIDDLIKQYCPNGVKYKELGNIGIFYGGLSGKSKEDFKDGNCKYITYTNIYSNPALKIDIEDKVNIQNGEKQNIIQYGDVLFTGSSETPDECGFSSVVTQKIKENIYLNSFCFGFRLNDLTQFNLHFLKHLFRSYEIRKQIVGTASGVTRFNVSKKRFAKIKIPVPPLPVQEEIVKVLDAFTALEAELEAELEARKRQYEYYRNKLLTFDENTTGGGINWKMLSEVFDIKNGYTPSKANKEFWKNGTIPWFRMEDIRENGRILNDSIQHITPQAVKGGKLFPANSIIVATTATIGEHALITVDSLANQQFTFLSKKVNRYNELDMKFFYYYMFVIDEWCKNNTNVSGFASVDMNKFKKLMIPIPPIEEQERIVAILDKFDSLVNDISEGLPAELTARRQQYEYYRNKLLTFDEAA